MPGNINFSKFWAIVGKSVPSLFTVATLDNDVDNHSGSGVEDFDRENAEDPQQHSEYAMETFQYYKNREETFRVPDYLQVVVISSLKND